MRFYPKLIAFDLDGTLLRSDKTISKRTLEQIRKLEQKNVKIVICTGRPIRSVLPIINDYSLFGLSISYNGAYIYDSGKSEEVKFFGMQKETVCSTIASVKSMFPQAMAAIELRKGWYTEADYYHFRKLRSELMSEPNGIGKLTDFIDEKVLKLLFRHPTKNSKELAKALVNLNVHGTWSFESLLEVSGKNVTKANALRWLAAKNKINPIDIAAFGDQNNDKEMLSWAGFGVAMGNAVPEAKQAADFITTSNDDEGIAEVLEKWLA